MTFITDAGVNRRPNPAFNHSWIKLLMKTNTGGIDRILRIAVGLVLLGLASTGTIGVWGWIGILPLVTGLVSWCPAYTLLGLNTCPMKR